MRNFGGILLVVGVAGFLYCGSQLSTHEPVPEGLTVVETLEHPAGRYETGRWASACAAGFGLLMAVFPKGR
jgi:hypothetical protein